MSFVRCASIPDFLVYIPIQYSFDEEDDTNTPVKIVTEAVIKPVKKIVKAAKKSKKDNDDAIINQAIKERNKMVKAAPKKTSGKVKRLHDLDLSPSMDFSSYASADAIMKRSIESRVTRAAIFETILTMDKTMDAEAVRLHWERMSESFKKSFPPSIPERAENPSYYAETMYKFISEYNLETASLFRSSGITTKFRPRKHPMVICSVQTDFKDLFPRTQFMVPYQELVSRKLCPSDALTYNPFPQYKCEFLCCCMFWSLNPGITMFGVIYTEKNQLRYNWIYYNRANSSQTLFAKTSQQQGAPKQTAARN